ncbi:unnamed protein product [Rotaria sp. Silwood1]|nr:unnamed protein product [Rotaria sp. Silwood1]
MKSVLSLISTQDLSKKFGRETLDYFISTFNVHKSLKKYINTNESNFQAAVLDLLVQLLLIRHFIYCIAEFLVMLSHDTLHSKQVIRIQDLIKHYDSLLASGHEPETHTLAALEPVLYDFFSCSSYANN